MLELDHVIGYNVQYLNTVLFHQNLKDTLIYNIGSLVIIESVNDKHNQIFLRGHDMEISALELSNSGKMLASGQKGSAFQKAKSFLNIYLYEDAGCASDFVGF